MARYHSDPWDAGLTDEDVRGLTPQMPELGDLETWQNQPQFQGGFQNPEPTEYNNDYPKSEDLYTAQATKDPIDEMLEKADRGEAMQRPAYMGEQGVQTQSISQPTAAPQHPTTQDNPNGESWGQYLRRTILGG